MRRIFYPRKFSETIYIDGNDAHHMLRVMRYNIGTVVAVAFADGKLANMQIAGISDKGDRLKLQFKLFGHYRRITVRISAGSSLNQGRKNGADYSKGSRAGSEHDSSANNQ